MERRTQYHSETQLEASSLQFADRPHAGSSPLMCIYKTQQARLEKRENQMKIGHSAAKNKLCFHLGHNINFHTHLGYICGNELDLFSFKPYLESSVV